MPTDPKTISTVMREMGARGGKAAAGAGGRALAAKLTPEQRSERAANAAAARWGHKRKAVKKRVRKAT